MISRTERLNEALRLNISKALHEEVSLDYDVFITVVRVAVSSTLEHATVWISVLPEDKTKEVLAYLDKNIYAIQQVLNRTLIMRKIPKISFKLDTTEHHAAHIEKLLETIVE